MPTPAELRRQRRGPGPRPSEPPNVELPFGRKNYILFGLAALVILVGYVALSKGSITLAPILLLTGYLVLIPWGILAK
ncbi:MAG: DUF3098 domain-containing protein [Candidatus Eisenbacteria bacterium]|uniref:DUF3098 domain-containing protein n=1 Tax=Eiseniibacteriota bacterium TaxID=2212470 RepID=A0A538TIA2_UNCEI|nr:MAG: DUF3098 domain-containing protein [Candidatus Eisenbacteria bacterium]TMQ63341.1 MAG: DUF3098 domain-containing protein [Candidatus Eisenbacteria bacterium]